VDLPESPIHNISDTARWVAVYRARESERPDAVFRDPFAEPLAGERGQQIAASMPFAEKNSWPFVARTWLIDRLISEQVRGGIEMVVNLAAGLDARPYRMDLPRSLQWVEVDLPEILAHKEEGSPEREASMRARASSVGFVGRASATRIIIAAWPSNEPGAGFDRRLAGIPNTISRLN
jgi:methyltransferase (TIGR00027 family)